MKKGRVNAKSIFQPTGGTGTYLNTYFKVWKLSKLSNPHIVKKA